MVVCAILHLALAVANQFTSGCAPRIAYLERPRIFRDLTRLFVVKHGIQEDEIEVFVCLQRIFVRVSGQLLLDTI